MLRNLGIMKALLIEDEKDLRESILAYLNGNDWICEYAGSLSVAFQKIADFDYDCILLDLMLPDGDGLAALKELRKLGKTDGLIIISAKDSLDSKISGLQLGADDYLAKPFHLSELLARMQALVRRKQFQGNNLLRFNEIEIDVLAKTVIVNSHEAEFTKTEIDLLLYLIGNNGRVLSKSAIAEHLSGDRADMLDNHNFVYAHVKNLKRKLQDAGCTEYVKTVYGLGYKWQE